MMISNDIANFVALMLDPHASFYAAHEYVLPPGPTYNLNLNIHTVTLEDDSDLSDAETVSG